MMNSGSILCGGKILPLPRGPHVARRRCTQGFRRRAVQEKEVDDSLFFTETGQKSLVEAMELSSITPELPELLAEMGQVYDPDRLADSLSRRPTYLTARALSIASSLGGIIGGIAADVASGNFEANATKRAGQLRDTLAGLGPSFVKVGQALSSRPDLLPK